MADLKTIRLKKIADLAKFEIPVEGRTYFVEENNTLYKDINSIRTAISNLYITEGNEQQIENPEKEFPSMSNSLLINLNGDNGVGIPSLFIIDRGGKKHSVGGSDGIISGRYDEKNKEIVLTLQNGHTIEIGVDDLVSGLVSTPDSDKGESDNKTLGATDSFNVLHISTNGAITERKMDLKITAEEVGARPDDWTPTWDDVDNKPTSFNPTMHRHPFTEITGVAEVKQIPGLPLSKIEDIGFVDVININDITITQDKVGGLTAALTNINGEITALEDKVDQLGDEVTNIYNQIDNIDVEGSVYVGNIEPTKLKIWFDTNE